MRGDVATVGGVEIARQTCGIAVLANIHVLADGTMETCPDDFLHAAMGYA